MERKDWGIIYPKWTRLRVNKLVSILGAEWFSGKRVLDVGCGHGQNGRSLMDLGASCVFTDGREKYINTLKEDGYEAYTMDQDQPWLDLGKFDLIVHWGVLYHLNQWEQDLKCALDCASIICLETEICDTPDPGFAQKKKERKVDDQALNGIGTLLSSAHLENYLTSLGATFTRYDDSDLDGAHYHKYSWKDTETAGFTDGQRRYWVIRKPCEPSL